MPYGLTLTTGPASEPLTVAQTKDHLRVDITDDDDIIAAYIKAAREHTESFLARTLLTSTWTLVLDNFPSGNSIPLPRPPLQSVSSLKYVDTDGTQQTWATTNYSVDTNSEPGRLYLAYETVWPSNRSIENAIEIEYVAGYRTAFTAATSDLVSPTQGTFVNKDGMRLYTTTTLPAGLSTGTDYFVISTSGKTFKLSATAGGSAVDITDTGTGTHYCDFVPESIKAASKLLVGHWYENREQVAITQGAVEINLPIGVDSLLWPSRIFSEVFA